jgi:hypothetical protein
MPPRVAVPNMDCRPTMKPSTENVFWLFRRVNVTAIRNRGALLERRVSGFDKATDLALTLLHVPPSAFAVPPKRLEGPKGSSECGPRRWPRRARSAPPRGGMR